MPGTEGGYGATRLAVVRTAIYSDAQVGLQRQFGIALRVSAELVSYCPTCILVLWRTGTGIRDRPARILVLRRAFCVPGRINTAFTKTAAKATARNEKAEADLPGTVCPYVRAMRCPVLAEGVGLSTESVLRT